MVAVLAVIAVVAAEAEAVVAEEVTDMKKARLGMFSLILMTLIFWSKTTWAESSIEWNNDREYSLTVLDNDNKPLLLIEIKYQGKSPQGDKKINHNWKAVDTDFYQEMFKNLSGSSVHIKEIKYSLDRGPLRTPRIKSESKIKVTYGTTQIMPNKTLYRDDAWVWAKRENVLHRLFVFSYKNREIEVDIPLVYQRE